MTGKNPYFLETAWIDELVDALSGGQFPGGVLFADTIGASALDNTSALCTQCFKARVNLWFRRLDHIRWHNELSWLQPRRAEAEVRAKTRPN
jgi:hypothetical protein